MKRSLLAAAAVIATTSSYAAPFSWVNGKVTSFTAQLPMYTTVVVNNKIVRFCDPATGADYAVTASNLHFDLLKTAFLQNKAVQVGVTDFGQDPQSGSVKLCIDRVLLAR
jgi:hypothetical protein